MDDYDDLDDFDDLDELEADDNYVDESDLERLRDFESAFGDIEGDRDDMLITGGPDEGALRQAVRDEAIRAYQISGGIFTPQDFARHVYLDTSIEYPRSGDLRGIFLQTLATRMIEAGDANDAPPDGIPPTSTLSADELSRLRHGAAICDTVGRVYQLCDGLPLDSFDDAMIIAENNEGNDVLRYLEGLSLLVHICRDEAAWEWVAHIHDPQQPLWIVFRDWTDAQVAVWDALRPVAVRRKMLNDEDEDVNLPLVEALYSATGPLARHSSVVPTLTYHEFLVTLPSEPASRIAHLEQALSGKACANLGLMPEERAALEDEHDDLQRNYNRHRAVWQEWLERGRPIADYFSEYVKQMGEYGASRPMSAQMLDEVMAFAGVIPNLRERIGFVELALRFASVFADLCNEYDEAYPSGRPRGVDERLGSWNAEKIIHSAMAPLLDYRQDCIESRLDIERTIVEARAIADIDAALAYLKSEFAVFQEYYPKYDPKSLRQGPHPRKYFERMTTEIQRLEKLVAARNASAALEATDESTHQLIRALEESGRFERLRAYLLSLPQDWLGRIRWPMKWGSQQELAWLIERLYGSRHALLEFSPSRWTDAVVLFIQENGVEYTSTSLRRKGEKLRTGPKEEWPARIEELLRE